MNRWFALLSLVVVVACGGPPGASDEPGRDETPAEAAPADAPANEDGVAAPVADEPAPREAETATPLDVADPAVALGAELASCEPVARSLGAGATLAARAGQHRLVLIEDADAGRRTEGTLSLFEMPAELATLSGTATPLGGSADIEVGAVGAYSAGELDSRDPAAPGVLVLEREGSRGRSILLRFGSSANRRDMQPFDGAYLVLDVHVIRDSGFAGAWRSAAQGPQRHGFFCAVGPVG